MKVFSSDATRTEFRNAAGKHVEIFDQDPALDALLDGAADYCGQTSLNAHNLVAVELVRNGPGFDYELHGIALWIQD